MTKEEYLNVCSANWEKLRAATTKNNLYDLEQTFCQDWEELGRQVLEKELGEAPKDYRNKKYKK